MIMERKKVLERYAYFYDAIKTLGEMNLFHTPTIDELNIPKSMVQTAYRDMKQFKFSGGVIDYLCYLSTLNIVYKNQDENKKRLIVREKVFTEKESVFFQSIANLFIALANDIIDGQNTIRLFNKDPEYLINSFHFVDFIESREKQIYFLFNAVYGAYYFCYIIHKHYSADDTADMMDIIFGFSNLMQLIKPKDKKQKIKR
jgi:hypothetical protein